VPHPGFEAGEKTTDQVSVTASLSHVLHSGYFQMFVPDGYPGVPNALSATRLIAVTSARSSPGSRTRPNASVVRDALYCGVYPPSPFSVPWHGPSVLAQPGRGRPEVDPDLARLGRRRAGPPRRAAPRCGAPARVPPVRLGSAAPQDAR
jgi:hypothetical protein